MVPLVGRAEGHENVDGEKFNAGEMIIEHIIDAHDWHVIGDFSIPLPIILIDEGELHLFMSSKFHHGHDSYNSKGVEYKIATEKEYKGKIVRVIPGTMHVDTEASVPLDLSITKNVASLILSLIFLTWLFLSVAKTYAKRKGHAPKGIQSWLEPLILFIRDDIAKAAIGEKKYKKFTPFLLTIFFFIFFNNLLGLVPFFPGGVNLTGSITITMVLALFTFVITTFSGNKSYWTHIFNAPGVPWWLKLPIPLMPVVEVIGVITKPFVLMVRLFANITAGHIIALGFLSLIFIFGEINVGLGMGVSVVSIAFMVFMTMLELLVAFIQAYVFTLLSAIYFGMAVEEHH
ncbi:MAG: F0F1 ATP synthase subunit A [Bacteroidales bacterium]|nr:F0F1 ATP synthase subunit A [Bacteroidales bacterium]